jgi:hypothetical protein
LPSPASMTATPSGSSSSQSATRIRGHRRRS